MVESESNQSHETSMVPCTRRVKNADNSRNASNAGIPAPRGSSVHNAEGEDRVIPGPAPTPSGSGQVVLVTASGEHNVQKIELLDLT